MSARRRLRAALLVACGAFACTASAYELVVNGSFEANGGAGSGTFTGWSTFAQAGSQGGFKAQTGTAPPLTPFTVPAPPGGSFAAMSDQPGPGGHVLYQDVTIPSALAATLTARVFVLNQAGEFSTPASLDYNSVPNQQARFDIVTPAAALQSISAGVLQNLFQTQAGDAAMGGYFIIAANLSAYAGQTIRLRFAETDNRQGLNFGIDLVSVTVPVTLDVDASITASKYDALTDGLLIIRYLFGLTGPSLTSGALGGTAARSDPAAIKTYLDTFRPALDIDGNGTADALTDGLLILRYMFGLRGSPLIAGAVDPLGTRTTAPAIEAYLATLTP